MRKQQPRREQDMTTRKAIALASLALALAILSPASAVAKVGGTDRPVKGTASGSARINLSTGAFSGDVTGHSTHIGNYAAHTEGFAALNPGGLACAHDCTTTVVAANGDRITGPAEISTADPAPGVHTGTVVTTITGGTGRFADATGVLTTTLTSTSFTVVGVCPACTVFRNDDVGRTTGKISY
jgi:hypothetical protein